MGLNQQPTEQSNFPILIENTQQQEKKLRNFTQALFRSENKEVNLNPLPGEKISIWFQAFHNPILRKAETGFGILDPLVHLRLCKGSEEIQIRHKLKKENINLMWFLYYFERLSEQEISLPVYQEWKISQKQD
eukprot:GHVP01048541.1.p1 GENE.GHVP01048541.1~~GHVP01048541.1.p1  ORF type:complete len:133 (+),score=30.59 GHVP01048541.1:3-401(+)